MKLSLAWLFTHIKNNDSKLNKSTFFPFKTTAEADDFFKRVSAVIAEIEHVEKITYSLESLFYATVITSGRLYVPELNKEITLADRTDLGPNDGCLIIKKHDNFNYLSLNDLYTEKEGLVPAVWLPEEQRQGSWKDGLTDSDYILTFDNKALTHRPDLWGHRGFAREVAALYSVDMVPDDYIFAQKPIRSFTQSASAVAGNNVGIENNAQKECDRIAGLTLSRITYTPSLPAMVLRLCAVGARPLNALVDATNYVMYDIGQPMHAFDADAITGDTVRVEHAPAGSRLELLDGTALSLTSDDIVITDGNTLLGLAGIMGGKASALSRSTKALFIEAASYAPSTIRKSSLRHKIRTESSTRFEKSLDPLYNTQALMRFLHLLDLYDVPYEAAQAIISVGIVPPEKVLIFSQSFIQNRIGITLSAEQIQEILVRLGFGVQQKNGAHDVAFSVVVPSFRATKDITIAEDIVEEIARFIGFNNLPMQLPNRVMKPFSIDYIMKRRELKRLCAFGFSMHEVSNYAFYDNQFLERIDLKTESVYTVANPVSEHWTRLVSSLIPHLLKNIEQNIHLHDCMAFFEMNMVWKKVADASAQQESCAGIWYHAAALNFYEYKEKVMKIFNLLSVAVLWRKPVMEAPLWFHPHQVAELVYDGTVIGYAGMISPEIMRKLSSGVAYAFEFNSSLLMYLNKQIYAYRTLSSFQPVTTDTSLLVPFAVTVDALESAIAQADARIYQVQLVDYFENPEWGNSRSITLRYTAVDDEKTFSKQEIEALRASVIAALIRLGVQIR